MPMEVQMAPKSTVNGKDMLAKLFWNGRSQAVRLPKEFRFVGTVWVCGGWVPGFYWSR